MGHRKWFKNTFGLAAVLVDVATYAGGAVAVEKIYHMTSWRNIAGVLFRETLETNGF